jgi:hypothetical protein
MKPRLAATIAVVSRYLMVPPPIPHSSVTVRLRGALVKMGFFPSTIGKPNVSEGWPHSTNLQRHNWSQTLLTKGTGYNSTSLRALSVSPATTRDSRKSSAWPQRSNLLACGYSAECTVRGCRGRWSRPAAQATRTVREARRLAQNEPAERPRIASIPDAPGVENG